MMFIHLFMDVEVILGALGIEVRIKPVWNASLIITKLFFSAVLG